MYYRRYVDDVFVLFSSPEHLPLFKTYLNSKHANISFTSECESYNNLSFLDVSVLRNGNQFSTSIYRKSTFSGVYTNFSSFVLKQYKLGLVYTLLYRIFTITSDFSRFHTETQKLRNILLKNGYPTSLLDSCIKLFLDKMYTVKEVVEKRNVPIVLPYLFFLSLQVRTRLEKVFNKCLPCCKLRVLFKSSVRISNFFIFKDRQSKGLLTNVVYKCLCRNCNFTYYGKTIRHLKVRASEHMGVSALSGKVSNSQKSTAVRDHFIFCSHQVSIDHFSILTTARKKFELELKESLFIHKDKPSLNKTTSSAPLYVFGNIIYKM